MDALRGLTRWHIAAFRDGVRCQSYVETGETRPVASLRPADLCRTCARSALKFVHECDADDEARVIRAAVHRRA